MTFSNIFFIFDLLYYVIYVQLTGKVIIFRATFTMMIPSTSTMLKLKLPQVTIKRQRRCSYLYRARR